MSSLGLNNFHLPVAARLYQLLCVQSESPLLFLEINTQVSGFPYFCNLHAGRDFRYKMRIKIHSSVII